jgi:hypothetical protein
VTEHADNSSPNATNANPGTCSALKIRPARRRGYRREGHRATPIRIALSAGYGAAHRIPQVPHRHKGSWRAFAQLLRSTHRARVPQQPPASADAAETDWQTLDQASATLQAEATTTASASERTGWRIYRRSKPTLQHECMQTLLIAGEKSVLSWPVLANLAPNTAGPRRCRASFCVDRESKLLVARVTWAARRMTFLPSGRYR